MANLDKIRVVEDGVVTDYDIPTGFESEIYSTNEQVVGQWIDGKPIYRKVFTGDSYVASIDTGLNTSVDTFVKMEMLGRRASVKQWRNIPWTSTIDDWDSGFYFQEGTIWLQISDSFQTNFNKYILIIEYTKTTDTTTVINE